MIAYNYVFIDIDNIRLNAKFGFAEFYLIKKK